MHRRDVLNSLGAAVGLSVVGVACGDGGGPPATDAEETLFVQAASLEFLAGPDRWLAFGIRDLENLPVEDAEVEVYLRTIPTSSEDEGTLVAGPLQASYSPATESGIGIYYLRATIEEPGFYEVVAVADDRSGTAAVQVVDPSESQVPVPGQEAISAPTATTEDDLGTFALCTQDPPCGMHEMSLDAALETGRPVVMMFATPEFCQTAVCGPSVATMDEIRTGGDWGDTIFVHSEIFAEPPVGEAAATAPLVPAVEAWALPSEPWVFTIGGDGVIRSRLDGPMPTEILTSLVEDLTA